MQQIRGLGIRWFSGKSDCYTTSDLNLNPQNLQTVVQASVTPAPPVRRWEEERDQQQFTGQLALVTQW